MSPHDYSATSVPDSYNKVSGLFYVENIVLYLFVSFSSSQTNKLVFL